MAMTKKAADKPKVDAAVKTETVASVKAEETKKEAAVKPEVSAKKEAVKKETVKKETVKKEVKPGRRAAAKKEEEPQKAVAGKKSSVKSELHIQFGGKSYSNEDLIKIAKDVWVYDLQQNESDMKDLELYVKPEENLVYYVINGECSGSFGI